MDDEKNLNIKTDSTLVPLNSIENQKYFTETSVKVDDYYKQNDLRGISMWDVCRIKEVAKNTKIGFVIAKEILLGFATAFLGAVIGKLFSGMDWSYVGDVAYFLIGLLFFVVFLCAYIIACTKQFYDNNKLVDAINNHLFKPLGVLEDDDNE